MKFNVKALALASSLSVVFWYAISTLSLMIMPMGVLQFMLTKMPMNMASLVVVNALIIFVSVFVVVATAGFFYNRMKD